MENLIKYYFNNLTVPNANKRGFAYCMESIRRFCMMPAHINFIADISGLYPIDVTCLLLAPNRYQNYNEMVMA